MDKALSPQVRWWFSKNPILLREGGRGLKINIKSSKDRSTHPNISNTATPDIQSFPHHAPSVQGGPTCRVEAQRWRLSMRPTGRSRLWRIQRTFISIILLWKGGWASPSLPFLNTSSLFSRLIPMSQVRHITCISPCFTWGYVASPSWKKCSPQVQCIYIAHFNTRQFKVLNKTLLKAFCKIWLVIWFNEA